MTDTKDTRPLLERRNEFERNIITETLEECDNNVRLAARKLGLSRTGLYKRMRVLGIALPSSEQGRAGETAAGGSDEGRASGSI